MQHPNHQLHQLFSQGDVRCPEQPISASRPSVVQWLVVISSGPTPLWAPLPIALGVQLEHMHSQEVLHPSSQDNPRTFHLPIPDPESAHMLLFGTNLTHTPGMTVKVNMRTGHVTY